MPDVQEALRETQKHLDVAERSRRPAVSDLPTMLRELHVWKNRYPKETDAILPFWYHCFNAELWSNCRAHFGVKFLVRADSVSQFAGFAKSWGPLGDLFVYAASFPLKAERGIDVFPWPHEILIPSSMQIVGFKEGKAPRSPEGYTKALIAVLNEVPYFMTLIDGKEMGYPAEKLFIVSRRYRVPSEILEMMLSKDVGNLIARRVIAMPVRYREDDTSLIHDICVAWENSLLPVFFGSLPADKEVLLERTVCLQFPRAKSAGRNEDGTSSNAHRSLRQFMAEVGGNPDAALGQLCDALGEHAFDGKSESIVANVHILTFKAGPTEVHHPAVVIPNQP